MLQFSVSDTHSPCKVRRACVRHLSNHVTLRQAHAEAIQKRVVCRILERLRRSCLLGVGNAHCRTAAAFTPSAVEHSLGLMCIHDLHGILLAVNPAVCESLGYSAEEGIGRNLREFLAPSVRPLFERYLDRVRKNGADSGLMRLVAKDGAQRIWMYRNIRYDGESEPQVLGHAIDITDRVTIEQQLKQAQRELIRARDELAERVEERTLELQRANRELRAEIQQRIEVEDQLLRARKLESLALLAGGIAHDFNNFLTIVQGNAALAQAYVDSDEPRQRHARGNHESVRACDSTGVQVANFRQSGSCSSGDHAGSET